MLNTRQALKTVRIIKGASNTGIQNILTSEVRKALDTFINDQEKNLLDLVDMIDMLDISADHTRQVYYEIAEIQIHNEECACINASYARDAMRSDPSCSQDYAIALLDNHDDEEKLAIYASAQEDAERDAQ